MRENEITEQPDLQKLIKKKIISQYEKKLIVKNYFKKKI